MAKERSFFYEFLRPAVWTGINLFFRRVVIRNKHKLPADRAVVIVANHQNALLDPVVLCISSRRQIHWLTRADVFKHPVVNKILRKINMLPVYRERDRVSDIHDKNNEIFQQCYTRMKHNAVIGIFPEGTHRGKKQLVPLKKGLARLVIGAYQSGVRNLCIVPVGLDYESFYGPQKNLLVTYGDPIELDTLLSDSEIHQNKLHAEITQRVHKALTDLMIHVNNDDVHSEILSLKPLLDKQHSADELGDQYDRFHALAQYLDTHPEHHHFLNHEVNAYRSAMHQLHLEEELYLEELPLWRWLAVPFGLPFAILAALMLWPIQAFTERFVHTVIKDTLFRNSIRISFWTFITPLYILFSWGILKTMGAPPIIQYFPLLAPIAGLITLPWWRNWKRVKHYLKSYHLHRNASFEEWKNQRASVIAWMQSLSYNQPHV